MVRIQRLPRLFLFLLTYLGVEFVQSIHEDSGHLNSTAASAAKAMTSIPFLKELVILKDTCNEEYFKQHNEGEQETDASSTCVVEYTGRLWFLRKTPIRFQEVIAINDISPCGTLSSIECMTKYKIGGPKADWVNCSRVSCLISKSSIQTQEGGAHNLKFTVSTDVLVRLPLFGIREKISRDITETFKNAADAFLAKTELFKVENSEECLLK